MDICFLIHIVKGEKANGCPKGIVMREMQENYYLVLFMFVRQLYFYVLGPISLLGYKYFNLEVRVFL